MVFPKICHSNFPLISIDFPSFPMIHLHFSSFSHMFSIFLRCFVVPFAKEIQVASQQQVLEDGTWCREQQLLFRPGRTEAAPTAAPGTAGDISGEFRR